MIKLNFIKKTKNKYFDITKKQIKPKFEILCNELKLDDIELNVTLCNNEFITELNEKYKKRQGPTDVLSFKMDEINPETGLKILGDIIISCDKVVEQAKKYKQESITEFFRLFIHGFLHLNNIHHSNEKDKTKMFKLTDKLLKKIKV